MDDARSLDHVEEATGLRRPSMDSGVSPACMLGRRDQVEEAVGVAPVSFDQVEEATGRDQVLEA